MLKVTNIGAGISYQDAGRIGDNSWLNYGVAPAGFMDTFSANAANTLVYNRPSDTILECLLGGQSFEVLEGCWIAHVGGCTCAKVPSWTARFLRKGETVFLNPSQQGVWSYLAIAGGWNARSEFGSSSRHERSDIGETIKNGSILASNIPQIMHSASCSSRFTTFADRRDHTIPPKLRIHPGPHQHLFTPDQISLLESKSWLISSRSDRTGYRINHSEQSLLSHTHSIHSTPTLVGSIQITPSGEPIITLNDGPTVGGYPIIARIYPDDLSWLVQQHANQPICFNWYQPST